MKRTLALILSVLLLCTLLTACGQKPAQEQPAQAQPAADNAPQESTATVKDTIKVGVVSDPASLAPYQTNMNSLQTTSMMYEMLFALDQKNQAYPVLAESYTCEDANHYTIKLHEGIVDSNGNPFTASDALFSLKLALEHGVFSLFCLDMENCVAEDDLTLKLVLASPDRGILSNLSFIPMVTEKAFSESPDEMITTPVATGPYKLVEWIPGSSIKFEYNDKYWGDEPSIKNVEYYIIPEEAQRTTALVTGACDLVYNLATSDVDYIKGTAGLAVEEVPSVRTCGLLINCAENSPCNDVNLRLAIAHATNAEAIRMVAFSGFAQPAESAYSPECTDACDSYKIPDYYKYDLDLAKEYMAKTQVPEGTTLKLVIWSSPGLREAAEQVQSMLKELGLNVSITEYENSLFTDIINSQPDQYDLAVNMFLPPSGYTADAQFVINMWTHMPEELFTKYFGYYSSAIACTEISDIQKIMTECQTELYKDCPLVSFCHTTYIYGYNSELSVPTFVDLENLNIKDIHWN